MPSMPLPAGVSRALSMLEDAGYEAFIVGGCVRDALMGVTPKDYDITTSALPEETKAVFREYRVIETGIQHGTVGLLLDGEIYEITTYRCDGEYLDNRHPSSVTFSPRIEDDLSRRDFTVNARENGFAAIIAAAGMAAHLAGAIAANTTLPVIGIPIKASALEGMDALLSTVQMPTGIPVATVAINGGANAALLAAQILAVEDQELAEVTKVTDFVISSNITALMMTQISQTREQFVILNDLLSDSGSELYMKIANRYVVTDKPVNFYTVCASASRYGEVAIGYKKVKEDGKFEIVLNPPKDKEIIFNNDDRLILLAEY